MSNIALMPQRPPYVEFEQRSEEDRPETIKQGHYVAKDVDYAIIRAIGAKDAVERPAVEWLKHIRKMSQSGSYPREWADFFQRQYDEWKQGHEVTPDGLHVKNWPAVSRAQADMLVAARILTVEDLAAANEETLHRIGMGARGLKQRAQAWLDMAAKTGSAEELAALRAKTTSQEEKIAELTQKVAFLAAKLEDDKEPEPRRKRA